MKAVYRFWKPIIIWEPNRLKPLLRMGEVHAPLLVLHGTEDKQIGMHHAKRLADASPGAVLELIEDANHWTVPRSPRFASVVVGFLDRAFGRR